MKIFRTIDTFQAFSRELHKSCKIGFVPTMGALHEGHISLVKRAKEENDIAIVSLFVNPIQFNNPDDLAKYPRTETEDLQMLEKAGVDAVFIPLAEEVYRKPAQLTFNFGSLETVMEGKFRPGHFNGVAVIVSKLFHWANANNVYFGQKDLQQVRIIETLIQDLSFDVTLVICPTHREDSGLAMSSRNRRLSDEGKKSASALYAMLLRAKEMLINGESIEAIQQTAYQNLNDFLVEYFEVVDYQTLASVEANVVTPKVAICVAATIENVRLIDNIVFEL